MTFLLFVIIVFFVEELEMLESGRNYVYKYIAFSADDNLHILSGSIACGALLYSEMHN